MTSEVLEEYFKGSDFGVVVPDWFFCSRAQIPPIDFEDFAQNPTVHSLFPRGGNQKTFFVMKDIYHSCEE
jgi:hypothetical protein